jgi:alkylation response protein AidB-like acyl-CoA dehydrogenase
LFPACKAMAGDFIVQSGAMMLQIRATPGLERLRSLREGGGPDDDLIAAVLEEAAKFSASVLAPLNPIVDRHGARFEHGRVQLAPAHVEAWSAFRDGGWTGIDLPESHGGQGLPSFVAVAVQESFDRACVAFGMASGAARAAARLLAVHGDKAVRASWLPRLASGEWGATICMSEADAGSDIGRARTRARKDAGGRWRIDGEKMWISFGDHPLTERIGHIVLARTAGQLPGVRGLSLFLVEVGNAEEDRNGVVIRRVEEKLGLHGSPTCAIGFEDAEGVLVGDEGRGVAQLFRMIVAMRLQVGTQGLGLAVASYEAALTYARDRRQGGPPLTPAVPIADHLDIRRMLADMGSRIETLRGLVYAAAVAADLAEQETDADARVEAATMLGWLLPIVKNSAAEIAFETAGQAILIFGGAGYSVEWPVEQYLRDARILAIYEGTTGMQAIDLVKRRLIAGNSYEVFRAVVSRDLSRSQASEAEMLQQGLLAFDEVVAWLRNPAREPAEIDAAAVPTLTLASAVAHAWIAARLTTIVSESADAHRLAACGRYVLAGLAYQFPVLVAAVVTSAERVSNYADAILN